MNEAIPTGAADQAIPTGLYPSAQGCEARATMGNHQKIIQPQRGCIVCEVITPRWMQPFQGCVISRTSTQGSSPTRNPGLKDGIPLGFSGTNLSVFRIECAAAKRKTFLAELGYD